MSSLATTTVLPRQGMECRVYCRLEAVRQRHRSISCAPTNGFVWLQTDPRLLADADRGIENTAVVWFG